MFRKIITTVAAFLAAACSTVPAPRPDFRNAALRQQPCGENAYGRTVEDAARASIRERLKHGEQPNMLLPSKGFFFAYELNFGPGARIREIRLNGKPIDLSADYRVAINSFLASGGDNF